MASIAISDDHMRAELHLKAGERITPAEAMALLAGAGVAYGVDHDLVERVGTLVGPEVVVVAQGVPAVEAIDARITHTFPTARRELTPAILPDGRADFRDLGLVTSVQPGNVLARRIPPSPPRQGVTVLNRLIQPAFPRDVMLRAGEGAALSEDGQTIVATIAGNPYLDGTVVSVRSEYTLYGGVTLRTGNIQFDGDLRIVGDVALQMAVSATGNVTIVGNVDGARVVAGGDIVIEGGVRRQSVLQAEGGVAVRLLENATVRCGGSLGVQEDLLHADVDARGSVVVGGCIVGGQVIAGERGEARVFGSRSWTPTIIRAVPPPPRQDGLTLEAVQRERQKLYGTLMALEPKVRVAQEALKDPSRRIADPEGMRKLLELVAATQQRDLMLAEQERHLLLSTRVIVRPRVGVREGIFPGVSLQVGKATMTFTTPYPAGTLLEDEGVMRILPL